MLVIIRPSILKIASIFQFTPGHIANVEVRNYFSGIMRGGKKAVKSRGGHMDFRKTELRTHNHSTNCVLLGHIVSSGACVF